MPQQLIDTLILSMGRRCETCLAVREIISPTKDGYCLLDTHHRDVSALSHIALHATFNKASFYPSDFSFRKEIEIFRLEMDSRLEEEKQRTSSCYMLGHRL
ncbi:hypothetical protein TNCV_3005491 [Trichonephila clavipes]|nr:hypothetical protein TNCV_3005491 [Trichonephila clavipes]